MEKETLTIIDNRTGKKYEIPVWEDTIRAMDLRQIKVNDEDFGMMLQVVHCIVEFLKAFFPFF